MGTLYLVATPIGNLEDISVRALNILRQVRRIAAEDTRQTRKLLNHYQISTPLISYHEHNKWLKIDEVLQTLEQGDVALVSDAGTPLLNDPGYELVRSAIDAGYQVSPIPGACAPINALIVSGLPTDAFLYLGYLPRKRNERRQFLQNVQNLPYTMIFLEAPHRLLEALQDLQALLGDRRVGVARELTKVHEEIWRGNLSGALAYFTEHTPRGEFVLLVSGAAPTSERWSEARLCQALNENLANGQTPSQAASQIATTSGWPRRQIYQLALQLRAKGDADS